MTRAIWFNINTRLINVIEVLFSISFLIEHNLIIDASEDDPMLTNTYTLRKKWVNLTHLMSLALVPKNTHIDESTWLTNPKVSSVPKYFWDKS